MEKKLNVGLAQIDCWNGDKAINLAEIEKSMGKAYQQGVELLIFPEIILTGFVDKARLVKLAEPRLGESFRKIQALIQRYPMSVVFSFPEYVSEDEIYNTVAIIDNTGEPLDFYRKIHLYGIEKTMFREGNQWVIVSIKDVLVGVMVCYDMDFPETARTLADRGAELLVVPSAVEDWEEFSAEMYIHARAMENQLFVAYCNRIGQIRDFSYRGGSMIVNPTGQVILKTMRNNVDIASIELDFTEITEAKKRHNYLYERRKHLYS